MTRGGTAYIMTSILKPVLYTGVTSDLIMRVQEHKTKAHPESFTAKYNVVILVYYNKFSTIDEAILEEKRDKGGKQKTKMHAYKFYKSRMEGFVGRCLQMVISCNTKG